MREIFFAVQNLTKGTIFLSDPECGTPFNLQTFSGMESEIDLLSNFQLIFNVRLILLLLPSIRRQRCYSTCRIIGNELSIIKHFQDLFVAHMNENGLS